ncbi:MAG: rhodanese-like domain-containing protein [Cyclobacteriaceae bacterium]
MDKKITICLIFVFGWTISNAQKTYDEKLSSLYKNTVPQIKSSALQSRIRDGQHPVILDTRSPEEYSVSHLPNAKFIDYDDFDDEMVRGLDKNKEVIVYCTVGYRSERIGEKLQKLGFTNVKNLYGGIFEWVNEGGEILNIKNQQTDSVHTYSKSWSVWLKKGIKVY